MAPRSPDLHAALRCFSLASFRLLATEVEAGAEVPFAFEEHDAQGRTTFYEFRPLIASFVEARSQRLAELADARLAIDALLDEPAARIFAGGLNSGRTGEDALWETILLPLVVRTADARGGFDWDDETWEREYGELERSLFGAERRHVVVSPLIGLEVGAAIELGAGIRVRPFVTGELSGPWPESSGLLPERFAREPDRSAVLELMHVLPQGATARPDGAAELADAVTALRLAVGGPVAAGPVLFERVDWRPVGVRPVLPIAAAQPPGEPTRLDVFRGELARRLREHVAAADEDPQLGEALDRWELSLFQAEPFRSEQLRAALDSLLGGGAGLWAAALRAAVLLGESGRERAEQHARLRQLAEGGEGGDVAGAVRDALVEALVFGDRAELVSALDESLLGVRPRPGGRLLARAAEPRVA
ncbi:MAG: hypothetical protein ICV59_06280 [Thermoleophilia bacterium]|nr:hypothetical protein [Thermoleophilia bacterium]